MLNLVIGFVLGLLAYKLGVTLPSLVAKVKSLFKKDEKVTPSVTIPASKPSEVEPPKAAQ